MVVFVSPPIQRGSHFGRHSAITRRLLISATNSISSVNDCLGVLLGTRKQAANIVRVPFEAYGETEQPRFPRTRLREQFLIQRMDPPRRSGVAPQVLKLDLWPANRNVWNGFCHFTFERRSGRPSLLISFLSEGSGVNRHITVSLRPSAL
jgi:hypothetical protein